MTANLPKLTITMLGTSGSGKSTYLLGLYSSMSLGIPGYFLHARDNDLDLDLSEAWENLLGEGLLPPPTPEVPKEYPLILKAGLTPLVEIDWLDYRGQAMKDRVEHAADAAEVQARLRRSQTVYLVIDASKLIGGVDDGNVQQIAIRTGAARMQTLMQNAFEGQTWPSVVVIVTKVDALMQAMPDSDPAKVEDDIVGWMQKLLQLCFQEGVTVMICPVSLGDFGLLSAGDQVRPERVAPVYMHKPLLFSLARLLERRLGTIEENLLAARIAGERVGQQLEDLNGRFLGRFQGARKDGLRDRIKEAEREVEARRADYETDAEQISKLSAELQSMRVFVDGKPVGWVNE